MFAVLLVLIVKTQEAFVILLGKSKVSIYFVSRVFPKLYRDYEQRTKARKCAIRLRSFQPKVLHFIFPRVLPLP